MPASACKRILANPPYVAAIDPYESDYECGLDTVGFRVWIAQIFERDEVFEAKAFESSQVRRALIGGHAGIRHQRLREITRRRHFVGGGRRRRGSLRLIQERDEHVT